MPESKIRASSTIPYIVGSNPQITQFTIGRGGRPDLLERRRAIADDVAQFADHLALADAELVRAIYSRDVSPRELARLTASTPQLVRRCARRLVARLRSPTFRYVIRHCDQWTPIMRAVATACILHAMPLSSAATKLNISYHTVRRYRDLILRMSDAAARTQSRKAS